jgi:hypothetical protein
LASKTWYEPSVSSGPWLQNLVRDRDNMTYLMNPHPLSSFKKSHTCVEFYEEFLCTAQMIGGFVKLLMKWSCFMKNHPMICGVYKNST